MERMSPMFPGVKENLGIGPVVGHELKKYIHEKGQETGWQQD